jgi:hypothetical protein
MLRQEAGIVPARTDVVEAKSTRRNRRQTQRGSQYLPAAFTMGAVEGEDIGQIGLPVALLGMHSVRTALQHAAMQRSGAAAS